VACRRGLLVVTLPMMDGQTGEASRDGSVRLAFPYLLLANPSSRGIPRLLDIHICGIIPTAPTAA
jgi:hypothetical protein